MEGFLVFTSTILLPSCSYWNENDRLQDDLKVEDHRSQWTRFNIGHQFYKHTMYISVINVGLVDY